MATGKSIYQAPLPVQIKAIEAAKGPVGKGHHNTDRTADIMGWLKAKSKKKK